MIGAHNILHILVHIQLSIGPLYVSFWDLAQLQSLYYHSHGFCHTWMTDRSVDVSSDHLVQAFVNLIIYFLMITGDTLSDRTFDVDIAQL